MKQQDKNTRAKVGKSHEKSIRKLIGKTKRLDTDYYETQMGEGYKVVWIVDRNNDLQSWLDIPGVEYVPESKNSKKGESGRAREWCGIKPDGTAEYQYALSVPVEIYDEIIQMKQEEARKPIEQMEARARAGIDNESGVGVRGGTYAPELPDGGIGIGH